MIPDERLGRTVSDWFHADAEHRIPDHLDAILGRVGSERQRPAWSILERWSPMDTTFSGRLAPAMRPARPLLVLSLLIALVATAVLVGAQLQRRPAPYGPAANGAILYADGDVWITDPDGTDPRVLLGGPEADVAVLASADGTRFAFAREASPEHYEVLAAEMDGSNVKVLTPGPLRRLTELDWSPDGSRILALYEDPGPRKASIIATDGSGSIRDLEFGAILPWATTWRPPDGREILFVGKTGGNSSIYAIGADGTDIRPLAPFVSDQVADCAYCGFRVSPDGGRVTFWHDKAVPETPWGEVHRSEVHVLDLATGVDTPIGGDPTARHELMPKFSPDGRSILFVRFHSDSDAATLHIAPTDGSGPARQVGPGQAWDGNPIFEFSPDGTKVIVSFGTERRLQVIDIATGAVETAGYSDFPTWQRVAP